MKRITAVVLTALMLCLGAAPAWAEGLSPEPATIPLVVESDNPYLVAELTVLYEDESTYKFEVIVRDIRYRYTNIWTFTGGMSIKNGKVVVSSIRQTDLLPSLFS